MPKKLTGLYSQNQFKHNLAPFGWNVHFQWFTVQVEDKMIHKLKHFVQKEWFQQNPLNTSETGLGTRYKMPKSQKPLTNKSSHGAKPRGGKLCNVLKPSKAKWDVAEILYIKFRNRSFECIFFVQFDYHTYKLAIN